MSLFSIASEYEPRGDQPAAIHALSDGVRNGLTHQTLLGVTGSGKTFTVANVIEQIAQPTLVIAHNKTLAAQLAQEYRELFPDNAVQYFVSYYDYYQPEAYIPNSDTYIEKEAQINEEIDRLRHATTQSLLTRSDVIIVASVSCIYSIGSPDEYERVHIRVERGLQSTRAQFIRRLIRLYFERTNADLSPGTFRAIGNTVEVMPPNEKRIYRIHFQGNTISHVEEIDAISREIITQSVETFFLFPAQHFVTPEDERERAIADIKAERDERLQQLYDADKHLEAERLKRRTNYDIAMIREVGYCQGIENYSRHFDGRDPGVPPYSLLSYFPHYPDGTPAFLTIIDESHVTIPQIAGMYAGDRARKDTLIDHGFRLPSARDNRPLTFEEFDARVGQRIYTSATPGRYELGHSRSEHGQIVEQIIRPTGLLDPAVDVQPVTETGSYKGQVAHFIDEAERVIEGGGRVLATTLTKKMAEDLTNFLKDRDINAEYLHSDVKTIDRINILTSYRKGEFDCLVGVNLLREGLDLPEVEFIGILDADKEGFLRSETSLIQTIGRAARNVAGHVVLYADTVTGSMRRAIDETNRRRDIQQAYNERHGITPETVRKSVNDITDQIRTEHEHAAQRQVSIELETKSPDQLIREKREEMSEAAKNLDFETAAVLRDEIKTLEQQTGSTRSVSAAD
jgi:excinuclease ABC subunit B